MLRLPLSLPLSDRVPVVVAAAISVALGAKDVLVMFLIENVSTLLMLLKVFVAKQTKTTS